MDGLYSQIRIALHQVWRRRWLAVFVAWGVAVLGWLVIALIPNSYEAKARLFVQQQQVLANLPGRTVEDRNAQMLRLKQTLVSNENLTRVVRRTDLNSLVASDRDLASVITGLRTRITVTQQPDGGIEIKAASNVPGLSNSQNAHVAQGTVQGLIDAVQEQNMSGDRQETGRSLQVLNEELARREAALREAQQRMVEFEQRFMGTLPGSGTIQDRMNAARTEIAGLETQIASASASVAAMRAQLAATPQTLAGVGGDNSGTATGQIAQLNGQIAQNLARGWRETHPDIVAARAQIARLRPYAASERQSGNTGGIRNPSYDSLRTLLAEREAQLTSATMRRGQLQSDLNQLSSRQSTEPSLAAQQSQLAGDYNTLKTQYDQLAAQREQIRLGTAIDSQTSPIRISVVEPPSVPGAPASPNRPLFLTLVLIVALGAGIAAAFVKAQLQTTFPTPQRLVQVTGLKVIGTVSEVVSAYERSRRRKKFLLLGSTVAALGGAWVVLMLVEFWQRSGVA